MEKYITKHSSYFTNIMIIRYKYVLHIFAQNKYIMLHALINYYRYFLFLIKQTYTNYTSDSRFINHFTSNYADEIFFSLFQKNCFFIILIFRFITNEILKVFIVRNNKII